MTLQVPVSKAQKYRILWRQLRATEVDDPLFDTIHEQICTLEAECSFSKEQLRALRGKT